MAVDSDLLSDFIGSFQNRFVKRRQRSAADCDFHMKRILLFYLNILTIFQFQLRVARLKGISRQNTGVKYLSYFFTINLISSVNLAGFSFISSFNSSSGNTSIPEDSPSTKRIAPS